MACQFRIALVAGLTGLALALTARGQSADPLAERASQVLGPRLSAEHDVYSLGGTWVVWLIQDTEGDLIEADAGPKSAYTAEFHGALRSDQDFLSEEQYQHVITLLSTLKDVGRIKRSHGASESNEFALLSIDSFSGAFIERELVSADEQKIAKLRLYYLQKIRASPEQIAYFPPPAMVCFGDVWYYIPSEQIPRLSLGESQSLEVAGPSSRRHPGCIRSTPVHDEDGFTIEQPQNETIVLSTPFRVRELAGRVTLPGDTEPVPTAHVEFLREGSTEVLRAITDTNGRFALSGVPGGKYRFKVTKDGFKSLRGIVTVDKHARPKVGLALNLWVGT